MPPPFHFIKFSVLKLTSFREAEILVLPDNDVIEYPDRNCLTRRLDLLRDLVILATWLNLPRWMVMLCGVLSYVE